MNDIESEIKKALAEVLANGTTADDIGPDADLVDEYGLDSLQMISFLLAVEDRFDVELDYEGLDLDDLRSVRQFTGYVESLRKATLR
ncbi:acyl carrier protein [Micromonospora sp. KC723]|uniref:acyl carrier protein n=1 Tax=Micromonospora sp. KC723 TaxID=2530381 RepID=UPI0010472259|nr:acyl carrier protein [Micromonospora sp. KC723]TDB78334.1 acyl carrier protein [Micromonospora sp. KC723]